MKIGRRILGLLLTLLLASAPVLAAGTEALPFDDVPSTAWYYDAVDYAYQHGLMDGTAENQFAPLKSTTRAMLVTILYRMEGQPETEDSGFVDVEPAVWYSSSIAWAQKSGVVDGYGNGTFQPNRAITREQMATILYRYARYRGCTLENNGDLSRYEDAGQVSGYAVQALEWANGAGLIKGTSDTTLSPLKGATRAECVEILMRFQKTFEQEMEANEETIATYCQIRAEAEALAEPYVDEQGYVSQEDLETVLAQASQLADQLFQQRKLTAYAYSQGDTAVYMQLDGWLGYLYAPPLKEAAAGEAAVSLVTAEPFAYEFGTNMGYLLNGLKGPDDAAELVEETLGGDFRFTGNYDNDAVNLALLENLTPNSILLWNGHGGYTQETGSVLSLGKVDRVEESIASYKWLLEDGALMVMGDHYVVTSVYFQDHLADDALSGSLIYLGACSSARDDRLAQSLWDKGARCILGNSTTVWTPYNIKMMYSFVEGLTLQQEDGSYYTVTEALDYAREKHGDYDWLYGAQVRMAYRDDFSLTEMCQTENHYYQVFDGVAATWEEAQAYCQSLGGHLATLTSQEENDYVYQLMLRAGYTSAYFGLSDAETEGQWVWVTGETSDYRNWHSGEPNGENSREDYAMFYYKYDDGTWNDGDFGNRTAGKDTAFLCEWDTLEAYQAWVKSLS